MLLGHKNKVVFLQQIISNICVFILLSINTLGQGCQTRGLMEATVYVDNRAGSRMVFYDLKIHTSPANRLSNIARSEVDLQKKSKKMIINSPASAHRR